jgi:PhnB protein
MHTLTPHLIVNGASGYLDFLKRAFGAVELSRAPGPGGKIVHASVRIGDSVIMLNDHFPEFGVPSITPGFWPVTLHLYVPDADAAFAQATAAGCKVTHAARGPVLGRSLWPVGGSEWVFAGPSRRTRRIRRLKKCSGVRKR